MRKISAARSAHEVAGQAWLRHKRNKGACYLFWFHLVPILSLLIHDLSATRKQQEEVTGQAERIAKFEETTRTAFEIIDAQAGARDAKTERLRRARLAAQGTPVDSAIASAAD